MPVLLSASVLVLSSMTSGVAAGDNSAQPYNAAAKVSKKADRLFRAKCASCHGRDGKGDTEQGKKMKIINMTDAAWQKRMTDAKIKETVLNGISRTADGVKKEMESFKGKVDDKKMALLIERIRAFAP